MRPSTTLHHLHSLPTFLVCACPESVRQDLALILPASKIISNCKCAPRLAHNIRPFAWSDSYCASRNSYQHHYVSTANMISNHIQRKGGSSGASRTPSTNMAPPTAAKPQSEPMQRTGQTLVSDSESHSPECSPSDDDLIFESFTSETNAARVEPLFAHTPGSLHNPLHPGHPTLLGIALSGTSPNLKLSRSSLHIRLSRSMKTNILQNRYHLHMRIGTTPAAQRNPPF